MRQLKRPTPDAVTAEDAVAPARPVLASQPVRAAPRVVIKIGGALLRDAEAFAVAEHALVEVARLVGEQLVVLIMPGGGPFADTVRAVDARVPVGDHAAHWMAILAMDQYAHLLVGRVPVCELIDDPAEATRVCTSGRLPVLASYRYVRARDPLPHSWDVTGDSIAAWVASESGAENLILVKASMGSAEALSDAYFPTVISAAVADGRRMAVQSCTAFELSVVLNSVAGRR